MKRATISWDNSSGLPCFPPPHENQNSKKFYFMLKNDVQHMTRTRHRVSEDNRENGDNFYFIRYHIAASARIDINIVVGLV